MGEKRESGKEGRSFGRIAARGAIMAILAVAGIYFLVDIVLTTPVATGRISQLLSGLFHQPATVAGVHFSGKALTIRGLTIANPAGFTGEPLLVARTVVVSPAWIDLLRGRRSFNFVRIDGLRVALRKNSAGAWNFSGLARLATGKKRPTQTFIRRLTLEKSAFTVNGRGIRDVSLTLNDLSTTGSDTAGISIAFQDECGSAYRVAGSARLGAHPAADLTLTVPSLALRLFQGKKLPLALDQGIGKLLLTARLRENKLAFAGNAAFERLAARTRAGAIPIWGALDFAGRYDVRADTATLDRSSLLLNGTIRLQARGKIEQVKRSRRFTATISHEGADLRQLALLVPLPLRRDFLPGGTILPGTFLVAGNGMAGITAGSTKISLRHGELHKGKLALFREVAADAALTRNSTGWALSGRVSQQQLVAGGALQHLDMPFTASFSSRLRLLRADVSALTATIGNVPVTGTASFRAGGKRAATGRVAVNGGPVAGKKFAVACDYRVADGRISLKDGVGMAEGAVFHFREISAPFPKKVAAGRGSRIPLVLRVTGIRGERGRVSFDALAGNLNATLGSEGGDRWLEGTGTATLHSLSYGGTELGSLTGQLGMARGKASAEITGKVLDGRLAASVAADPFALAKKIAFSVHLAEAAAGDVGIAVGRVMPIKFAGGSIDVAATGEFTPQSGVRCHAAITGRDIITTGKNGRPLLKGGTFALSGDWAQGSLFLRKGAVGIGKVPTLELRGELAHAATSAREGAFTIALPQVSLASVQKEAANLLPRQLQEGELAGTVAAAGNVRIQGKRAVLDGEVDIKDGTVELPAQKLSISPVNGTIPFSLDFAGTAAVKAPEKLRFTRENFPKLLALLQKEPRNGRILSIGNIRLGLMELGPTTLTFRAGNGLTEFQSLKSTLFRGVLLGHGFFRYQGTVEYGADMLLHEVSLREVCNTYPAIKGYLSGRVDGLVSLFGKGTGVNNLAGYLELWTHSSKDEKMLVSKAFLQKLAGKKFKGLFFREDRPFDQGRIGAWLESGYLTFDTLDISHTNFLGLRDLSVTVAPLQNRIELVHLFSAIKEAAARGKVPAGSPPPAAAPAEGEFKWEE